MKRILVITGLIFLLLPQPKVQAQTVEDYLVDILTSAAINGYEKEYITSYMQPLTNTLGMGLSGAMYHRGYTKGLPRFDVGVSSVFIPLPEETKTFVSPFNMSLAGVTVGQQDVPTVFGSKDIQYDGAIPGTEQDFFVLPLLQVNVGLLANLEATARFVTTDALESLGKLTVYGGGLKYGLSELLPIGLPFIDFSVQADYHKFVLGDIIDAGTFSMNFHASGSLPVIPVDIYGGVGYDQSSMTIKTDALDVPTPVGDITINGENKLHFKLGASVTLTMLNIHAAYNIGKYNYFSGGVMLVL